MSVGSTGIQTSEGKGVSIALARLMAFISFRVNADVLDYRTIRDGSETREEFEKPTQDG